MNTPIPIAHSVGEACKIAKIGRTGLYAAIKAGELGARKRGRRTLIIRAELERWIQTWTPIVPAPANANRRTPAIKRDAA